MTTTDLLVADLEAAAVVADERVTYFDGLAADTPEPQQSKVYSALSAAYQTLATELRA